MTAPSRLLVSNALWWPAAALGALVTGYAALAAATWCRYGYVRPAAADESDPLLDQFMPDYEVAERHHVWVAAPAEVPLSAAAETDLYQAWTIRAIFRARELVLGSHSGAAGRKVCSRR